MGLFDSIAPGKKNKQKKQTSTQIHLRIGEIRDDVLVLKNGGMRAIFKTSSINFNLKSEPEQNAIIQAYQNFLNSLEFPIQIVVRSKKLDIDDYIDQVKTLGDKQKNPLLQEQTYEYSEYIKKLVEYADIMEKQFYVVVPYNPARAQSPNFVQKFFQNLAPKDTYGDIKKRQKEFQNVKKQLIQRVNIVETGLESCGLKVEQLETKKIIELFYEIYNPKISQTTKLKDLGDINIQSPINQ